MKKWQMQEAKAKLSKLIKSAVNYGPQEISVRGKSTAVILSIDKYRELVNTKDNLVKFMRKSPLVGIVLNIERNADEPRKINL